MKTIMIHTDAGVVTLQPTTTETFDLNGPRAAVEELIEAAPVLQPEGNSMAVLGDVIVRFMLITAHETPTA